MTPRTGLAWPVLGLFWAYMGSSGLASSLLGSPRLSWALLASFGALLGSPGAVLGSPGLSWALLGLFWALLGCPGAVLGPPGLSWALKTSLFFGNQNDIYGHGVAGHAGQ